MNRIEFTGQAGIPSLLVFPAKGNLLTNVTLSPESPSQDITYVTDDMLAARDLGWVKISVIQPDNTTVITELSSYVVPSMPESPLDMGVWIPFTALNNWVPIVNATPAQYRRVGDEVSVRFAFSGGNSLTVWNAPIGFRSKYVLSKVCQIHDNTNAPDFGHIQVRPNGDLVIEHPGSLNNHKIWADFTYSVT